MNMHLRPSSLLAIATAIAALAKPCAHAQDTFTWDGGGLGGAWNTGANWLGDLVPDGNDVLVFAGGLNLATNNDIVGYNGYRIVFDATALSFVLDGNALTLFDFGGAAPRIENLSTSLQTINLPVTLNGTGSGNVAEIRATAGGITFGALGTVALAADTNLSIFGNVGATLTFDSAISGAGLGNKLVLKENSVVVFNAVNTYAGNTEIDAGELQIGALGSIAAGTTVFLGNGGTTGTAASFALADVDGGQTFANLISVNPGNGANRTIKSLNVSGINTITGNIAMDGSFGEDRSATFDVTGGGSLAVSGIISGAGQNIIKTGGGTLVLNGANTFTGNVTVNAGTLTFGAANNLGAGTAAITLDGGALNSNTTQTLTRGISLGAAGGSLSADMGLSFTVQGIISGGNLTKTGAGTVLLGTGLADTVANTFTGTTTVSAGTLRLNKADGTNAIGGNSIVINGGTLTFGTVSPGNSNQLPDTASITMSSGGVNWFNANETLNSITATGGNLNAGNANAGIVTLTGTLTISGAAALTLNSGGQWTASAINLGSTATVSLGGNSSVRLTQLVTGPGGLTLTGQTLSLNSVANSGSSLGSEVLLNGKLTSSGTSLFNVNNVYGTRHFTLNDPAREIEVISGTLTANAPMRSGGIVKTGAGTLVIGNAIHSFANGLTINAGTVNWFNSTSNATAPIDGGIVINAGATLNITTTAGGIGEADATFTNVFGLATNNFTINGGTLSNSNANDRTLLNRTITIGAGGATFDIAGTYSPAFVETGVTQLRLVNTSGYLLGSAPIIKTGGGRLTLRNSNPGFSGPWTVNNGTIETTMLALGDGSATNTLTINGGNVALATDYTHANTITLGGGALSAVGGNRIVSSPLNITANSFFFPGDFLSDTNPARTLTLSGIISAATTSFGVAVNRPGLDTNSGTVILKNTANAIGGIITVGKNLRLQSNPTGDVGSTLGAADIVLAGGHLQLRDNGSGDNGTLIYGNDVEVSAPAGIFAHGDLAGVATLDVARVGGVNVGNVFRLGGLNVGADLALNVTGANNYGVEFSGVTNLAGNATFNPTTAPLTLLGGISGGGNFIKNGASVLTIHGTSSYTGSTDVNAGRLHIVTSNAGIGGTGKNVTVAAGATLSIGYVLDQSLVDRITLASAGTLAAGVNSANALNLSGFGALSLGALAPVTLSGVITSDSGYRFANAGAALTLSAVNALSGTNALTVSGPVNLTAANSFTGNVLINGGAVLQVASDASLGNSANTVTGDNGTLQFATGSAFDLFALRTVIFGPGGFALDTNANDYAPSVAITGGGGAGAFTKTGNGVLNLSATSTYTGATTIAGGALRFSNSSLLGATSGLTLNASATLDYTGGAAVSLGKTLALPSGTGQAFIQVSNAAGELTLDQIVSGANGLRKTGPGTLRFSNTGSTWTGALFVDAGVLGVVGAGAATYNEFGTGTKNITISNGATLRLFSGIFNPNATTKNLVVGTGGGVFDTLAGTTIQLDDANQLSGSGNIAKTGGGLLDLRGAYTAYTGSIDVQGGSLDLRGSTSAGTTGNITLQAGTQLGLRNNGSGSNVTINYTNNNVTVAGNSTIALSNNGANTGNRFNIGNLSIGAHTLIVTNANSYKLGVTGTTTLAGSPVFNVVGTANTLTLAGPVSGGTFGFTKTGTQGMTLGGGATDATPNAFTGLVTVSDGLLLLDKLADSGVNGGYNLLGDSNTATKDIIIGGGASVATLRINDNEQIKNDSTVELLANGVFDLNGKTETIFNVLPNGGSIVRGGGNLILTSPSADLFIYDADALPAQTLTGINAHYVGATTAATVASLTLAGSPVNHQIGVANGTAADDLTITGVVDGAGQTITKTGPGVLLLTGANTFGGAGTVVTSAGGVLAFNADAALGNAANTLVASGGGTFGSRVASTFTLTRTLEIGTGGGGIDVGTGNTVVINSSIANVSGQSGAFVKTGAGTVSLNGTNTFDGGVVAAGGFLKLNGGTGNGPVGPGPIVINGGAAELRNDVSNVYGNHVNAIGSGGTFLFSRVGASATNQTLTIGDFGQGGAGSLSIVGSLGYVLNVANINHTGTFLYGNATSFVDVAASSIVVASGGNVTLGGGSSSTIRIGSKNVASASATINSTLNAANAASFIVNAGIFEVGVEPASGGNQTTGNLLLPANANITATTNVSFGDSNNQGASANVQFGNGTSTITTPAFTLGGRKSPNAVLTIGSGGILNIGNGVGRTTFSVGSHNVDTAVNTVANFNASGATVNASLGQVVIGRRLGTVTGTNNSTVSGTVNFGTSPATNVSIQFDTGTPLTLGNMMVSNTTGMGTKTNSGTLTHGGGILTIGTTNATAPGAILGSFANTAAGGSATGNTAITALGVLNVTGGSVSINTGGGPAISLTPNNAFVTLAQYRQDAEINISGGSLSLNNDIVVGVPSGAVIATSTINLSGGVLDLNGNDIGNVTNFNFTGGTLREMASLDRSLTQSGSGSTLLVTDGNTTINGVYSLTGGIATVEATRTLSATSVTQSGGTLTVNGTLSGSLTVSGGLVQGSGTLAAATFNGGTLAPGNSPGALATGSLSLLAGSTFAVELGGTAPGTGYDQVSVTGGITLGGTLNVSLFGGFTPAPDSVYFLVLNDGTDTVTNTFAGLAEGALVSVGGYDFNISYFANGDAGSVGNDIALTAVPEPASTLLLLGGLAALATRRRRSA